MRTIISTDKYYFMRLPNIRQKIKETPDLPKDVFALLLIVLVALGAFMLGEQNAARKVATGQLRILSNENVKTERILSNSDTNNTGITGKIGEGRNTAQVAPLPARGAYVGSKNGKVYHLPWCGGATRIREENKVWFTTKEEATAKGYSPAANCKGI